MSLWLAIYGSVGIRITVHTVFTFPGKMTLYFNRHAYASTLRELDLLLEYQVSKARSETSPEVDLERKTEDRYIEMARWYKFSMLIGDAPTTERSIENIGELYYLLLYVLSLFLRLHSPFGGEKTLEI